MKEYKILSSKEEILFFFILALILQGGFIIFLPNVVFAVLSTLLWIGFAIAFSIYLHHQREKAEKFKQEMSEEMDEIFDEKVTEDAFYFYQLNDSMVDYDSEWDDEEEEEDDLEITSSVDNLNTVENEEPTDKTKNYRNTTDYIISPDTLNEDPGKNSNFDDSYSDTSND